LRLGEETKVGKIEGLSTNTSLAKCGGGNGERSAAMPKGGCCGRTRQPIDPRNLPVSDGGGRGGGE